MPREYYLISKIIGQKFIQYKNNALKLSVGCPYTVDEVVVGIRGKDGLVRKITTFRDSKGNIIERAFDYFDKPYKNRLYTKSDSVKGEEELITSTTIKQYSLRREILDVYKNYKDKFFALGIHSKLWKNNKTITNHVCENINTNDKIFSQVLVEDIKNLTKQRHTFIEFPHIIGGKVQDMKRKFLKFDINTTAHTIYPKSCNTQKIQNPEQIFNDTFLPFRALGMEDIKIPLTKYFIEKRGLSRMELVINTNFIPQTSIEERMSAFFLDDNGSINFNKQYKHGSKSKLVSIIRHEVEHAWQYYLDARNIDECEASEWQEKILKKFGRINNPKLKKEADKYTASIDNYVSYDTDFKKYLENYIEKIANQAGANAWNKYDKQGEELRKTFPYIPPEML